MSQIQQNMDKEQYAKKLGEVLNLLYKKTKDLESKVNSIESQLSGLSTKDLESKVNSIESQLSGLSTKDLESKVNSIESQLSGLSTEVVALKERVAMSNEINVSKQEYERFINSLSEAIKSISPETQQEVKE
ncbi:hypothetical protein MUP77_05210 [Candidatus Bathyarchaeota archaeon]|nr:hypothetical protein [Candidatus Bathyarchaeota archaeon]